MKSKADKQVTNPKQVSKATNEKKQQQPAKEKSIVNTSVDLKKVDEQKNKAQVNNKEKSPVQKKAE